MATIKELQEKIAKLEKGINSKATKPPAKAKARLLVNKFKKDIADIKAKEKPKATTSKVSKAKEISKEIKRKYSKSRPFGKSDIYQDAQRPAKPIGRRTSAEGNTYYEYRENRTDRKQPPRKYPRLEDGGMMAKGGMTYSKIKSQYLENEDENAHSENVVLLAKHFGTESELKEAKRILQLHDKEGFLSTENGKKRQELHLKLIAKARKEMSKEGIKFADGGAIDLLSDTSGAGLQNVGGTAFSNVDLTPQMDITNPMFANGGETHRSEGGMYAKGGMTEHGLKVGDKIIDVSDIDSSSIRVMNDGKYAYVNLSKGTRKEAI